MKDGDKGLEGLLNDDHDGNNTAIVIQPAQIKARAVNKVINQAKPTGGAVMLNNQNQAGKVFDRHPLDKAQVYKSDG